MTAADEDAFIRRQTSCLRVATVDSIDYWLSELTPDSEGVQVSLSYQAKGKQARLGWRQVSAEDDERHAAALISEHHDLIVSTGTHDPNGDRNIDPLG